jgi:hypothetical protein
MLIEPISGLLIDKKKLSKISGRGQVTITLSEQALIDAGFVPGEEVNIVFGKKKIVITNDIKELMTDLKGIFKGNVIGEDSAIGDVEIKS